MGASGVGRRWWELRRLGEHRRIDRDEQTLAASEHRLMSNRDVNDFALDPEFAPGLFGEPAAAHDRAIQESGTLVADRQLPP